MSKQLWKNTKKHKRLTYELKYQWMTIDRSGYRVRVQCLLAWNARGEIADVVVCESPEMAEARGFVKA